MALFLVTGGCGFIGSNLTHALVARGERVRIVDNLSTGRESNLSPLRTAHPEQVEFLRGDITDSDLLDQALQGVDYVLHQAAVPSVSWSIERPLDCERINIYGTLQVLEAVRRQGRIRRVVFAASCAAYGDLDANTPKRESDLPVPLSPYAVAKLAGEHLCAVYTRTYGIPTVALRYFNVFGPRQDPSGDYAAVIPRFIAASLVDKPPIIYGDGRQSRDFCFVDNIVDANLLACTAPAERIAGQTINVGCGESISLLDVLRVLGELLGRKIVPRHETARSGEVRHSCSDLSRAQALLGYKPRIDFSVGLERTVTWYRASHQRGASQCAA